MELLKYKKTKDLKHKMSIVFLLEDYIILKNTFFGSDKFRYLDNFNKERFIYNLDNSSNLKTHLCESMIINTIILYLDKEDFEFIRNSLFNYMVENQDFSITQIIDNINHNLSQWGENNYSKGF